MFDCGYGTYVVKWKIPNYSYLPPDRFLSSDTFMVSDIPCVEFKLSIRKMEARKVKLSVSHREDEGPMEARFHWSVELQGSKGHRRRILRNDRAYQMRGYFISKTIDDIGPELLPDDTLTIKMTFERLFPPQNEPRKSIARSVVEVETITTVWDVMKMRNFAFHHICNPNGIHHFRFSLEEVATTEQSKSLRAVFARCSETKKPIYLRALIDLMDDRGRVLHDKEAEWLFEEYPAKWRHPFQLEEKELLVPNRRLRCRVAISNGSYSSHKVSPECVETATSELKAPDLSSDIKRLLQGDSAAPYDLMALGAEGPIGCPLWRFNLVRLSPRFRYVFDTLDKLVEESEEAEAKKLPVTEPDGPLLLYRRAFDVQVFYKKNTPTTFCLDLFHKSVQLGRDLLILGPRLLRFKDFSEETLRSFADFSRTGKVRWSDDATAHVMYTVAHCLDISLLRRMAERSLSADVGNERKMKLWMRRAVEFKDREMVLHLIAEAERLMLADRTRRAKMLKVREMGRRTLEEIEKMNEEAIEKRNEKAIRKRNEEAIEKRNEKAIRKRNEKAIEKRNEEAIQKRNEEAIEKRNEEAK